MINAVQVGSVTRTIGWVHYRDTRIGHRATDLVAKQHVGGHRARVARVAGGVFRGREPHHAATGHSSQRGVLQAIYLTYPSTDRKTGPTTAVRLTLHARYTNTQQYNRQRATTLLFPVIYCRRGTTKPLNAFQVTNQPETRAKPCCSST